MDGINIYDFIEFPSKERRAFLRNEYDVFSKLKQVNTNIFDKYNKEEVPFDFFDYQTIVSTWIVEYNHSVFALTIPLYQMLNIYHKYTYDNPSKEHQRCFRLLINYYSEIIAYYIECAFKKSVNIFNAMFGLKVNDENGSFYEVIKEIRKESKGNPFLNKIKKVLEEIYCNPHYLEILSIRNKNTHSIRPTQQGFIDKYDKETGVTTGKITSSIDIKKIIDVNIEAIKILSGYTEFINSLEEDYYGDLYGEHAKWVNK